MCTSFFSAFHIPQQMNIVYLNYFVKFPSTKIDLQIAFFDPSFRPHELSDRPVHDDRKDDAKKQKTDPVHRSDRISFRHLRPAGDDADRTDHAGGSHTGGHRRAVISELKYAGSDGTENHGGEHRRNPENRFFHQVRNLKHRGTESLRHKAPIPLSGKLSVAKPSMWVQQPIVAAPPASARPFQTSIVTPPSPRAVRTAPPLIPMAAQMAGRTDREGEYDADHCRNDNSHQKWLQVGRPSNESAQRVTGALENRSEKHGAEHAHDNGYRRRHDDVHLCLFGY